MDLIASVCNTLHMHSAENKAIRRHALNTKNIQVIQKDYNKLLHNLMKQDDALSLHEESFATSLYRGDGINEALYKLAQAKATILNTTIHHPYIFSRKTEMELLTKIINSQSTPLTASTHGKLNNCLERIDYAAKKADNTRKEYLKVLQHLNSMLNGNDQFIRGNIFKIEQHVKYFINLQRTNTESEI